MTDHPKRCPPAGGDGSRPSGSVAGRFDPPPAAPPREELQKQCAEGNKARGKESAKRQGVTGTVRPGHVGLYLRK